MMQNEKTPLWAHPVSEAMCFPTRQKFQDISLPTIFSVGPGTSQNQHSKKVHIQARASRPMLGAPVPLHNVCRETVDKRRPSNNGWKTFPRASGQGIEHAELELDVARRLGDATAELTVDGVMELGKDLGTLGGRNCIVVASESRSESDSTHAAQDILLAWLSV
eukprot:6492331-Amphidinium_carterae.1